MALITGYVCGAAPHLYESYPWRTQALGLVCLFLIEVTLGIAHFASIGKEHFSNEYIVKAIVIGILPLFGYLLHIAVYLRWYKNKR